MDLPQGMQRAIARQAEAERGNGGRRSFMPKGSLKLRNAWPTLPTSSAAILPHFS